jgi:uncharacterized protein YjbJ (UPF0337 family)
MGRGRKPPMPKAAELDTADAPELETVARGGSMNRDELKGKTDRLKGNIKESVGEATNDPDLRDEGIADQAKGNVQEGFGKGRRKVGDALHDVAHKIKE